MIRMNHARTILRTTPLILALLATACDDSSPPAPGTAGLAPGPAPVTDGVKTDWWDQAKTKKKLEGEIRDGKMEGDWHSWF
jgi:hypothetical protein